jgi:hypothetical protein
MNAIWIITVFHIIDDMMETLGHHSHVLAQVPDSEVLTVAVVSAKFFQNHHERALGVLQATGYLSGQLSTSRFNRRLHALADWLPWLAEMVGETFATGEAFVIDSLPMPVCRRVRAWRCRKVRGRIYCGYCAAKNEKFFGWRLHLVCPAQGEPVRFTVLPASLHDLTPLHELADALPEGAHLFGDKGYVSAPDAAAILEACGVRVIARPRDNMEALDWADEYDLRLYRHGIETVNSQLEKMGLEHLYARTTPGFMLKVNASMFALACSNLD